MKFLFTVFLISNILLTLSCKTTTEVKINPESLVRLSEDRVLTCYGNQIWKGKNMFVFPKDGGRPFGSHVEVLLKFTNKLKLKLEVINTEDGINCYDKMRNGEIDIMVNLVDKGDRRDYMELIPYPTLDNKHLGISKKSKFISRKADFFKATPSKNEIIKIYSQIKWERPDQHFWYGYVIAFCYSDPNNSHWYLAKTADEPGWGSGDSCYTPSGSVTPWNGEPCIGGSGLANCISACETAGINCNTVVKKTNVSIKLSKNCEDLGKSEGGGRKVTLNFNNQTNSSIEAFWVDFEGKLKSYGTISSGEIREQGTFEKHPWLFEYVDTKKCLGTYNPQLSHDKKQLNIME